ncbi:MAG: DUF4956 domain-containing protein [Spirochaetes bacterium]|nr:DUF4956 domain-containing protein [Spirochaetota bacterium]
MKTQIENFMSLLSKGFGNEQMGQIGFFPFIALLFISLLASMFISYLYLKFYRNRATGSQIHRAFPLLGIAITAIFICIQFSLPLSLGLLGALSIVRFRTPIKEPEEIGFIMLVVATSISCATFNLTFMGIILVVAYLALLALQKGPRFFKGRLNDGMLIITLPTPESMKKTNEVLQFLSKKLPKGRLENISENSEQAVVSYSFTQADNNIYQEFKSELNEITADASMHIFVNRIADI